MSAQPLPIANYRQQIVSGVESSPTTIIIAPPGTGKTTEVPQFLSEALPGKILVLEPRRLAARLSAERVAKLRNSKTGDEVGYWIRHDRRFSDATRIIFLTEGVFVQMLRFNSELTGISAIVLDEVHERNIHTDIAMALLRRRQLAHQPCPKLVLMSATLEAEALESYFDHCIKIDVKGVQFPVELKYSPLMPTSRFDAKLLAQHISRNILPQLGAGNVLVFLTGIGEIRSLETALLDLGIGREYELLGLASTIDANEQAKVFATSAKPKMILATNIAETSLTIPGVTAVIDTGLAKISGFTSWSALPTIEIRSVSQSSCIQRAGRAGRTAPGQAFRLFTEADFLRRPQSEIPELRRSDLVPVLLDVLTLISAESPESTIDDVATGLPWLSPPEPTQWQVAADLLKMLRLVDEKGRLTQRGRSAASLPIHPRLASIWQNEHSADSHCAMILLMVMVSESFHEKFNPASDQNADGFGCDLRPRLLAMWHFLRGETYLGCSRHEAQRWRSQLRAPFLQLCRLMHQSDELLHLQPNLDCISEALLRGFPDRVAKINDENDPDCRTYHFCGGGGGELHRQSFARSSPVLICLSLKQRLGTDRAQALLIERAASVSVDELLASDSPLLKSQELIEASARGNPQRFEVQFYGNIELKRRLLDAAVAESSDQLALRLKHTWPQALAHPDELEVYHARARIFLKHHPDAALPLFEGEMLELFIESIAQDFPSWQLIRTTPVGEILSSQIDFHVWQELNLLLPRTIKLPNGKSFHIDYLSPVGPMLTGPIQDFYGCAELPKLCGGKESLTVELLGPNKRPIQRTSQLAGFWSSTYPQLLKEYSRNYPRHYWPQDPVQAAPYLLLRHLPQSKN